MAAASPPLPAGGQMTALADVIVLPLRSHFSTDTHDGVTDSLWFLVQFVVLEITFN